MICFFNNGLSFKSVDSTYTAQTGEVIFNVQDASQVTTAQLTAAFSGYTSAVAAQTKASANALIQAKIDALETTGHRAMRSILIAQLASTTPSTADVAKIQSIDSQITALRATLQS